MGRIGVDLYPEQIGVPLADVRTFRKMLGGSATNVAVAAARYGRSARRDHEGGRRPVRAYARQALAEFGVDASPRRHPPHAAHPGRLLRDLPARQLSAALLPRADGAGHDARGRRARPRRDRRGAALLDDRHRALGRAEPLGDARRARGARAAVDHHPRPRLPAGFWELGGEAGSGAARRWSWRRSPSADAPKRRRSSATARRRTRRARCSTSASSSRSSSSGPRACWRRRATSR